QKLTYITPTIYDGESMAELPEEVLEEGAKEWEHALVGFFVGKKITFRSPHSALNKKSAAGKFSIHTADNGIFVFKCESVEVRNWILDNEPWDVWGVHLALRLWETDLPPIGSGFTKIPVWVKLMNIPMEYWTTKGLSHLASVLGTPLHMDPATEAKQMISFARICVKMNVDRPFPDVIKSKRRSGAIVEVKVEYSWKPLVCESCKVFDHSMRACLIRPPTISVAPESKSTPDAEGWVVVKGKGKEKLGEVVVPLVPPLKPALKNQGNYVPPRNIEVPKTLVKERNAAEESPVTASPGINPLALKIKNIEGPLQMDPIPGVPKSRLIGGPNSSGSSSSSRKKKKKILPTCQSRNSHYSKVTSPLDVILPLNDMSPDISTCSKNQARPESQVGFRWNIRGLIKQREVKSLTLKNNIAFMGLLETRVRAGNKDRVARGLPRGWKSVTNHAHSLLGRIWVIWNPSSVQFTVIDLSHQAIHGSLIIGKSMFYVSIVYGSCDYREMRNLWENLIHHYSRFSGKPWVILGDFNVSRYPREHSGVRPLLSKSMVEFDQCIRKCEVEDLRKTHLFSWSNKRSGARAVAKKIDRAMGNCYWFKECSDFQAHFPHPGISDHSPCIL
ncbi:LOW QUALITY PROTEIN: Exo_endo_phos domain-containing protein/DUF4283 domain-containing protein/zf-CCHC_4 domain-containing protein, partial [Cephalotus follicularis]